MHSSFRQTVAVVSGLSLLILFSCADSILNATATFDAPFQLKYAQTKTVQPDNLAVTFEQLISDSRCPIGVECVIAGAAEILLAVQKQTAVANIHLTIGPYVTKEDTSAHPFAATLGYRITLMQLDPHPRAGKRYEAGDYKALIRIHKNEI